MDGAWKRYRQQLPRAGIVWTASIAGNHVFAGNTKIMTLSSIQTEAYAMYQGLREAFNRGIRYIQIQLDCAELVRAIESHQ